MIDISKITLSPLPQDVKLLAAENVALKKSNRTFKYMGLGLGLGILSILVIIVMYSRMNNDYEEK